MKRPLGLVICTQIAPPPRSTPHVLPSTGSPRARPGSYAAWVSLCGRPRPPPPLHPPPQRSDRSRRPPAQTRRRATSTLEVASSPLRRWAPEKSSPIRCCPSWPHAGKHWLCVTLPRAFVSRVHAKTHCVCPMHRRTCQHAPCYSRQARVEPYMQLRVPLALWRCESQVLATRGRTGAHRRAT